MSQEFEKLAATVARLRGPKGCPWDAKQTHESLRPFLLEEVYEVLDALHENSSKLLREELGDLFLQILLHAQIEAEQANFTIEDVMSDLTQKLIRRHPHVFDESQEGKSTLTSGEVIQQWEEIKKAERAQKGEPHSLLDGVSPVLPALFRACLIQSRASRVGFDWEIPAQVVEKLDEELEELRKAVGSGREARQPRSTFDSETQIEDPIEQEFGDVLFTVANLARFLHIDPEEALRKATNRFVARFQIMEARAAQAGKDLKDLTPSDWDSWWEEAKLQTQQPSSESSPSIHIKDPNCP